MMPVEHRLRFPAAVLCAGPVGVFFAYGLEIEGNVEAGLARLRATDAGGRPMIFSVLVDLNGLPHLRRICTMPNGAGILPVSGGTSVSGCDENGILMMKVQETLEIERDSLGVLVLAPGPEIPWSLGVPPGQVGEFLSLLEECVAGAALVAVA